MEERVLAEAFWQLLVGKPVPAESLYPALRLSSEAVEETLAALEAERSLRRDETGAVVAARGLMTSPSPHRLVTVWGSIYTQCTVDAVGIPAALGLEATVEDQCSHCGSPIEASVWQSGDVVVHPASAVIVMAQADSCVEDGIPKVCQETNFFCSSEHAETWQREQATLPSAIVSLEDAATAGREIWGRFTRRRKSPPRSTTAASPSACCTSQEA
jgi:hypothetical protein